ncbi:MAG: hypothetical protein SW833_09350 [Cyanobacteriota bacterium]|nr:hypothetical protein [Cyanobacteriota bacterium]
MFFRLRDRAQFIDNDKNYTVLPDRAKILVVSIFKRAKTTD